MLLSVIGSGGFAIVHHAKSKSSGQEVAIKMVDIVTSEEFVIKTL